MNLVGVGNHLWQSTIFALFAWLLVQIFRKNSARVRYSIWMLASLKFLFPLSLLIALGDHLSGPAKQYVAAVNVPAIELLELPFGSDPLQNATARSERNPTPSQRATGVVVPIWLVGVTTVVVSRLARVRRVREILSTARRLEDGREIEAIERAKSRRGLTRKVRCATTESVIEPGIHGIFRPTLVLPSGLAELLEAGQLDAIVDHEICHVRWYDNLSALIHMWVETIFWFHPLVWWMGTRLVDERERACDEQALENGGDPQIYASAILKVCEFYVASPLECVAGVSGGNLKRRIEEIMKHPMVHKLSGGKKLLLAGLAILAVAAPTMVGVLTAPSIRAQSPPPAAVPPPKFEVASIKPCIFEPQPDSDSGPGGRGAGAAPRLGDPGLFRTPCAPLRALIQLAYIRYADGSAGGAKLNDRPPQGGPGWIDSERFIIDARPATPQARATMGGPMLQALLEERFNLKIHRETKEIPAYALVVARGGPKLQATPDGSCTYSDAAHPPPPVVPGQPLPCGYYGGDPEGVKAVGVTIDTLCDPISTLVHRKVINKTGLTGLYSFNLDVDVPPPNAPDDPTAFDATITALQKLGLRLESTKAAAEFIVIDHIERPTQN
jgi:bla regulator protein blaR1